MLTVSQTCDQLICVSPGCLLGELTVHLALNIKLLLCFTLVKSTQLIWSEKDLSWFRVTLPALYVLNKRNRQGWQHKWNWKADHCDLCSKGHFVRL